MKKNRSILAILFGSILLSACANTPVEPTKETTPPTQETTKPKENTEPEETPKPEESSKPEETPQPAAETEIARAEQRVDSIANQLQIAYKSQDYTISNMEASTSETGNAVIHFSASKDGQTIEVDVTATIPENQAEKTFEANCANDQRDMMQIMDEWTNNGNIVRVIRNNRANLNYVEVLDSKQQVTLHIQDSTPEQLDVTLNALNAIDYPVS